MASIFAVSDPPALMVWKPRKRAEPRQVQGRAPKAVPRRIPRAQLKGLMSLAWKKIPKRPVMMKLRKDYFSELDDQLETILDGELAAESAEADTAAGKTGMPLSSRHVKVHDSDALELDMHAMEHVLASFCSEHQLEPGPASLLLGELGLAGGSGCLDDMD
eukprot:g24567.t1